MTVYLRMHQDDCTGINLRPGREMEIESVEKQMALAEQFQHQTYVAENGVHGSSMLVSERVKGEVDTHWQVVEQFLEQF